MQVLPSTFRYERILVCDYLKGFLYSIAAEAWSFRLLQVNSQLFESGENQEIHIVTASERMKNR
jgi:hypothetical protein